MKKHDLNFKKKYLPRRVFPNRNFYLNILKIIDEIYNYKLVASARVYARDFVNSNFMFESYVIKTITNKALEKLYFDCFSIHWPYNSFPFYIWSKTDIAFNSISRKFFVDKVNYKIFSMWNRIKKGEKLIDLCKEVYDFLCREYTKLRIYKSQQIDRNIIYQSVKEDIKKLEKHYERNYCGENKVMTSDAWEIFENGVNNNEEDKVFLEAFETFSLFKAFLRGLPEKVEEESEYFKKFLHTYYNCLMYCLTRVIENHGIRSYFNEFDIENIKKILKNCVNNEYRYLKNPNFNRILYIENGRVYIKDYARSIYEEKISNNECVIRYHDSYHKEIIDLLDIKCRNDKFHFDNIENQGSVKGFFHRRILYSLKKNNSKLSALDAVQFTNNYGIPYSYDYWELDDELWESSISKVLRNQNQDEQLLYQQNQQKNCKRLFTYASFQKNLANKVYFLLKKNRERRRVKCLLDNLKKLCSSIIKDKCKKIQGLFGRIKDDLRDAFVIFKNIKAMHEELRISQLLFTKENFLNKVNFLSNINFGRLLIKQAMHKSEKIELIVDKAKANVLSKVRYSRLVNNQQLLLKNHFNKAHFLYNVGYGVSIVNGPIFITRST